MPHFVAFRGDFEGFRAQMMYIFKKYPRFGAIIPENDSFFMDLGP